MNVVILIGNVGQDPEVRTTQGGSQVANFSLATSERWKDKDGGKQEKTTWHRCIVWGPLVSVVQSYIVKGSRVGVEGRYETRKWTDKEGAERVQFEVNVVRLELLGEKRASQQNHQDEAPEEEDPRPRRRSVPPKPAAREKFKSDMDLDDDIPW
jgi:single-strand DNA-binding protein